MRRYKALCNCPTPKKMLFLYLLEGKAWPNQTIIFHLYSIETAQTIEIHTHFNQ